MKRKYDPAEMLKDIERAGSILRHLIDRAEGVVKAEDLQKKTREIAAKIFDAAMIAEIPGNTIVCLAEEIPFDSEGNCISCGEHDPEPGWCCLKCGEYIPNIPTEEEIKLPSVSCGRFG